METLIPPHGGRLVDLRVPPPAELKPYSRITLNPRQLADFELLAVGALSPLEGFMDEGGYHEVLDAMRLSPGIPWPLPIVLPVESREADPARSDEGAYLVDSQGNLLGFMEVTSAFTYDKKYEAEHVYGTEDPDHPGVSVLMAQPGTYLGGKLEVYRLPVHSRFVDKRFTPKELRVEFTRRHWKTVVGFQTRNPIHRAHEYITKCALETVDGLLIHPLMGSTKDDDISPEVRMQCYDALVSRYYPPRRVIVGIFPAAMRYGGPREAVFHALVRKNYGCSHFIVGRDHAGVGNYYGTYEAQEFFDRFDPVEIAIKPFMFEHAFYCTRNGGMATAKTSPSAKEERIFLSGTKVRQLLKEGAPLPPEFTRPEVAEILQKATAENRATADTFQE